MKKYPLILFIFFLFVSCQKSNKTNQYPVIDFGNYTLARVRLDINLTGLSEKQKLMVLNLIKASQYADSMFLYESAGKFANLYKTLDDSLQKLRFKINFGPWDRFNNNLPFIIGVPQKPKGANYYPFDMLIEEFNQLKDPQKYSHYTFIRRDSTGNLYTLPYHKQFSRWLAQVVKHIQLARTLSGNEKFTEYLQLLVNALNTDDYYAADSSWLKLNYEINFVFGPKVIQEDRLLGIKADHQAFVLLRDNDWTSKIERYQKWLKYFQLALPVKPIYRREQPGRSSKMVVYNVVYYGGSAHAGPVIFSETLPINPRFQIEQGGENMLFKNVIFAKSQAIVRPLSDLVLIQSQSKYVKDTAFFISTLLWEIADNLGIRNTVNGRGTVRYALKEYYSVTEHIKNNLLILFLIDKLDSIGELPGNLKNYYYTFAVDLVRQIRWGPETDYGLSALVIFNELYNQDAIDFLPNGKLILHFDKIHKVVYKLISKVIEIQGTGDYQEAAHFILKNKFISPNLRKLLNQIEQSKIPIDIYLEQGTGYLNFN